MRASLRVVVFTSCADDPVQPSGNFGPQFSQAPAGRYIVELRGNDVKGLRAAVSALGGHLEFAHTKRGSRLLIRSVDDLGAPGHDPLFGAGRINVPRALGLR